MLSCFESLPPRRVLLIRGGAIGDFILTLPALAALRRSWPGSRITLVGQPRTNTLALAAKLVDEAMSIDSADLARLFAGPEALTPGFARLLASFDLAISWLSDADGVVEGALRHAGISRVVACAPMPVSGHAADHLASPLKHLGVPVPFPACSRLELPPEQTLAGEERLRAVGRRVLMLHPGSGGARKNWPLERFLELAGRMETESGVRCAFSVGEADENIAARLRAMPGIALLPPMTLLELAQCLRACAAYVGNDSGITHLASAVGCKVVTVFGPTDPAVWGPRGVNVRIITAADRTPDALQNIPVGTLLSTLRNLLAETV